jgi:hypothetical protein
LKTIRLFAIFIFLSLLFQSASYCQIAFDIKTSFKEKSMLRFVKLAVINNIQNSDWATVKEIGEDYSLWLTNFERNSIGDSIEAQFDIDVRTPAMFSQGKPITNRHIILVYDTTGCASVSNDADTLITNLIIQGFEKTNVYSEMLQLVSSSIPLGHIFFGMFADKFIKEFKRRPTALEQLESNLLGAKTVIELHNIFKAH